MTILDKLKKKKSPEKEKKTDAPRKKILIVDDDPGLHEMYQQKFLHEGFEVITADNGKKGLDMTVAQKPNIILLDVEMPVMDGKIMLHKLREMSEF